MKKNKGFTLVEVIVILVILAILAAVLIPSLTTYIDKAREKSITANARGAYVAAQAVASEQYGVNELYDWQIENNTDAALGDYATASGTVLTEWAKTAYNEILTLAELQEYDATAKKYTDSKNVTTPKIVYLGVDDGEVAVFAYTEGASTQQRWALHQDNGTWTIFKDEDLFKAELKTLTDAYKGKKPAAT